MGLVLEAMEVAGPLRWRWLLREEETGKPLADHPVKLVSGADELARFENLYAYVRSYASPDRRTQDGARFVAEAGAWAGRELLGDPVGAAILEESPVTVRVSVPTALDRVLLWPLELAHAGGKPLAAQGDVTFVYDVAPEAAGRRKSEVGASLRMLAVFSQPTGTSVLALRRERHALTQLIGRIAARQRAAVQLRVVQYGVTRQRLRQIADSADGWDVLHLSGHGAGGVFVLEHADGTPDLVTTDELVALLRPGRRRMKLAVVSACESAADTTAQTLRLLGLAGQTEVVESESGEQGAEQIPGLARRLVRELDCAVVGMRYPVTDEFAIAFADVFYEHLYAREGQPVDVAVARAVAEAAGAAPSAGRPAVSLGTPGVFGARAAGLVLAVPRGQPDLNPAEQAMAYFPDEPSRFVGRAEAMARASAALAPGSTKTAVLLHGMAGAGKTACALELAYRHADSFAAAVFWQAPTRQDEWAGALADLTARLDIQLASYGFAMAGHIGTTQALEAFLPRLRSVMARNGLLLVLDNLETLLTEGGAWRDPRWGLLIAALTSHGGESRVILTSRTAPASLVAAAASGRSPTVTLPVHALSLEESAALARELPHLRELLHTDPGPVRSATAVASDRELVRRVLRVVQGHPKLMELADAAAADRARLEAQLTAAEEAAAGHGLETFFRNGTSALSPEEFLSALAGWTAGALGELAPAARLMAEFIACLEDRDRVSPVVEANWEDLWRRLGRSGEPPKPAPLLAALTMAALVVGEPLSAPDAGDRSGAGGRGSAEGQVPMAYRMHPGVAAAIVSAAEPEIRDAVDAELAAFWDTVAFQAFKQEGGEDSQWVVRAGLAGAPYLLRQGEWEAAGNLLENVVRRDESLAAAQAAVPGLRRVAAATGTAMDTGRLARALWYVDVTEAERLMRAAIKTAAGAKEYRAASAVASDLINLLRDTGRLREALVIANQSAKYTRRARLGPWTQLSDQGQRLQLLSLMGQHARVLAEVDRLRAAMTKLPTAQADNESAAPWNVRETVLDVGHSSALATGDWQRCLDLNAEIMLSKRERGAAELEIARTRFNDGGPLIQLGRIPEAQRLLAECQQVSEAHADAVSLYRVLGMRGRLESTLGHHQIAADLTTAAIRLNYANPEPRDIAMLHLYLGAQLRALDADGTQVRAQLLAAALIYRLVGMTDRVDHSLLLLAADLSTDTDAERLPATVAEVVQAVERTDGVRFGELLAALRPDPRALAAEMAAVLTAAEAMRRGAESEIARLLETWQPAIASIADACRTRRQASAELLVFLDKGAHTAGWAPLVAVLHRILDGERDESVLAGLDPASTLIAQTTLERIRQRR